MKKVIGIIMVMVLIFTLSACGKNSKPTATIEDFTVGRSTCNFSIMVDDKDVVTKGSVIAKFYEVDDSEDILFTTKTITGFEGTMSTTGLTSGRDYRVDILCTYDKEQQIILSKSFSTSLEGTFSQPIVINNAEELIEKFGNEYSSDVYYELGADIDFADVSDFQGLCQTSATAFSSNLDGKGYKIKNVTVTSDLTYNGFFGYVKGVIKNVVFENIKVNVNRTTSSTIYVGAVAGYGYQGKLINVDIDGVTMNTTSSSQYVGSLVGYAFGTNITSCNVNNLNLTATGMSSSSYVGGLAGYLCQNSGSKYGKINTSTVAGTISVTGNESATSQGSLYYGGITAYAKVGSEVHTSISNINATIKSKAIGYYGGIVGYANFGSDVDNCKDHITDIVAMGKITYLASESEENLMVGGLIGSATAIQVKNAFVDIDLDIAIDFDDENDNTDEKLYAAAIFGNGYEYHTSATNVLIDCVMTFTGVTASTECHIDHTYDGAEAAFIDNCLIVQFSSTKDLTQLNVASDLVGVTTNTIAQIGWDILIWDVKIENSKFVISFE